MSLLSCSEMYCIDRPAARLCPNFEIYRSFSVRQERQKNPTYVHEIDGFPSPFSHFRVPHFDIASGPEPSGKLLVRIQEDARQQDVTN